MKVIDRDLKSLHTILQVAQLNYDLFEPQQAAIFVI